LFSVIPQLDCSASAGTDARLTKRKLEMTQIETLKAQALNLKHAMDKMGVAISLAQALEAIAGQYGMENWDTLAGVVNGQPLAPQAQLAGLLSKLSMVELKGCSGTKKFCTILYLDQEALTYAPNETQLQQHVAGNPKKYPAGMANIALRVRDSNGDYQFSLAEVAGMTCDTDYWYLASGLVALRFHSEVEPVQSATRVDLVVPQMAKSAKGCQLLILPSHDGAEYDRHVIVPPHLKADVISVKLAEEIRRLKEIDRVNEENDKYDGYTDEDIARYVRSIGCLWVGKPAVVAENWD
jgi:hypothetical protein